MGFSNSELFKQYIGSIKLTKFNLIYFFIIITWLSLCFSINTLPREIHQMFDGTIKFINSLRILVPLIMSVVSILILSFFIFYKKIKNTSVILILFFLYFLSQILGLINTPSRDFDLDNTYLIIFALGSLSILILLDNFKSKKISYSIISLTLLIFTLAYLFIILKSPGIFILAIQDGNLYNLFNINNKFLEQSGPRITGATRIIGIFTLFCITVLLLKKKNNKINYLLYILILLLSLFIWLGQSRGSLLCFYTSLFFLIFFLNNLSVLKKIILIVSIPLISISMSNILIDNQKKIFQIYVNISGNELSPLSQKIKKKIEINDARIRENKENFKKYKNFSSNRVLDNKTSSGRFELWEESISEYKKDKIFGYGPQGDRYILWQSKVADFYSSNSSNLLIYGFLSGGYVGLIILILIYIYIFLMMIKFFLINKIYLLKYKITKSNIFYVLSIITSIFFLIRSLFENSYGLFSIDFLLMIISLYIIESNYRKKQT